MRPGQSGDSSAAPSTAPTLAFEEFQAARRFPALDGVRAIAILLVFTAHPAYAHFWPSFHGPNGVTIFFVLSGFLITTLALREETRQGSLDLTSFYIRRLCRIYPLYTAVLLLYCVLLLVVGLQAERRAWFVAQLPYYSLGLPEHAFFLRHVKVPFDGAWSLGIEEKFYLLWPILLVATLSVTGYTRRFVVLSLIGLVSLLAPFISPYGIYLAPYVQLVFGCVAALLLHRPSTYDVVARLGRYPVVAALGALLVVLQFLVPGTETGQHLYAPYGVVACLLLIGLVTTTAPWVAWLWSRPMVVTATLSYALYLVHNFGLNFAEKLVPGGHGLAGSLVSTALGLSLAYLIAYGLNRTVERPFISLGHRITRRRRRALDEVSPDRLAAKLPGRDHAHSPGGGPSVLKRP